MTPHPYDELVEQLRLTNGWRKAEPYWTCQTCRYLPGGITFHPVSGMVPGVDVHAADCKIRLALECKSRSAPVNELEGKVDWLLEKVGLLLLHKNMEQDPIPDTSFIKVGDFVTARVAEALPLYSEVHNSGYSGPDVAVKVGSYRWRNTNDPNRVSHLNTSSDYRVVYIGPERSCRAAKAGIRCSSEWVDMLSKSEMKPIADALKWILNNEKANMPFCSASLSAVTKALPEELKAALQ